MSDGGKGSARRPSHISDEAIKNTWESIFGISRLEKLRRQQALEQMSSINQELGLYESELQESKESSANS